MGFIEFQKLGVISTLISPFGIDEWRAGEHAKANSELIERYGILELLEAQRDRLRSEGFKDALLSPKNSHTFDLGWRFDQKANVVTWDGFGVYALDGHFIFATGDTTRAVYELSSRSLPIERERISEAMRSFVGIAKQTTCAISLVSPEVVRVLEVKARPTRRV